MTTTAQERLGDLIDMNAEELARDDDYSLSCDLFDLMANDDKIREQLNKLIADEIRGVRSIDYQCKQLRIARQIIKFGAEFYKERSADFLDD